MKLIMTLLVRDEADIVASNIDFHLRQGVDFIIATDNLSVDGTTDILRSYERRGLLHYIHQAEDNYAQHRWVTHMARLASTKYAGDWVINSDADEFWWPNHGDLKRVFCAVSPTYDAIICAERVNFLPRPMGETNFFADVMTLRESRSLNATGELLPAKVCHRAFPDIEVDQGNHGARRHGRALAAELAPITIFHFPMRSYRQFANKIINGGAAYERNNYLPANVGATWRYLYKIWKKGELESLYRQSLLDEASVERGLAEGHLLTDSRLKRFFSAVAEPTEKI